MVIIAWRRRKIFYSASTAGSAMLDLRGNHSHESQGLTDPSSSPSSSLLSSCLGSQFSNLWSGNKNTSPACFLEPLWGLNEMRSIKWLCDPSRPSEQLQQLVHLQPGSRHQEGRAGLLLSRRPESQGRQHCRGQSRHQNRYLCSIASGTSRPPAGVDPSGWNDIITKQLKGITFVLNKFQIYFQVPSTPTSNSMKSLRSECTA